MRYFYLLFLIAAGCGPTCTTRCGLVTDDLTLCADMQKAEDYALTAYHNHAVDPRFEQACALMDGWLITDNKQVNNGPFLEELSCVFKTINVRPTYVGHGMLVHSIAHIAQHCSARGPATNGDHDHARWDEDGINASISEAYKKWLSDSL